mmetsp:Transcript_10769/g.28070  ORF Transcript_10769/g.28070 Transcript_10769/m.28070 type:complete len:94 (+) Transcript_10769:279-560(+)
MVNEVKAQFCVVKTSLRHIRQSGRQACLKRNQCDERQTQLKASSRFYMQVAEINPPEFGLAVKPTYKPTRPRKSRHASTIYSQPYCSSREVGL